MNLTPLQTALLIALRSGKYPQTTGLLHRTEGKIGFCCLGVACEVAIENGVGVERHSMSHCTRYINPEVPHDGFNTGLPSNVRKAFGFNVDAENVLIRMNDEEDKTLVEIADYIEQNADKVFEHVTS